MTTAVLEQELPTSGNQKPRFLVAPTPEGYNSDHAEDAIAYAAFYGLKADEWQETTCEAWMRQTREGKWCAGTWGITVSRQNGKNATLEIFELYGMVHLGLKILHTAHEVKTAKKAFQRLKHFFGEKANDPNARFPDLNAKVREIRHTNGQEAIVLKHPTDDTKDWGTIEFIARSKGSGRGFTVDVLVLDEAQDLQDVEFEALKPTNSAAPSGQPLTIFMGTPPREVGTIGEPFIRLRDNAVTGKTTRAAWVEFSADAELDEMRPETLEAFVRDPRNWADANPAWGTRVLLETIQEELELFSARSFARERLNMWPMPGGTTAAMNPKKWSDLNKMDIPEEWPVLSYGLDMNPQRSKVTIAVTVDSADEGPIHLEIAVDAPFDDAGTSALVEWLWDRAKRRIPVVIDSFSPAKTLEPHLKKKKMKVYLLNTTEFMQACGNLYDAVMRDKSVTHANQKQLNESVKGTYKEFIGDPDLGLFKWNRINLEVDLGPIIAVTCAHFGAIKFARRRRTNVPQRSALVV